MGERIPLDNWHWQNVAPATAIYEGPAVVGVIPAPRHAHSMDRSDRTSRDTGPSQGIVPHSLL
eukprot:1594453-Pyramimonas_sp.AAC.1